MIWGAVSSDAAPILHAFHVHRLFHASPFGLCLGMTQPPAPVVWLQPAAPPKPAEGAPCNGCGLCCLAEPCPLGVLVSRRRRGACAALRWDEDAKRYLCGVVADPASVTGWQQPWALRALAALARRWIAAGVGCDAQLQVQPAEPPAP